MIARTSAQLAVTKPAMFATAATVFAATILVANISAAQQNAASLRPAMCWTPQQLRHNNGEQRIRKNTKQAFIPRPVGKLKSPLPGFRSIGARNIRRVDLPKGVKKIAFTFDLCEQPYEISGYQGDIVDFLRRHKVPATFFASGKWMMTHARRAQQLMADPLFEIGNHAWEHRNFRILSADQTATELNGASLAYQATYDNLAGRACYFDKTAAGNRRPAHHNAPPATSLFRFPFGACTPAAMKAVSARGMHAVQWDVSSADPWTGQTKNGMVRDVMRRVRPGSIVLFHANGRGWKTGDAIPTLIRRLRAQGYQFTTVTDLLNTPGGRWVTSPMCYDSKPGDANRYDKLARRLEGAYQNFYKRFASNRRRTRPYQSHKPYQQGPKPRSTTTLPPAARTIKRVDQRPPPLPGKKAAVLPVVPKLTSPPRPINGSSWQSRAFDKSD